MVILAVVLSAVVTILAVSSASKVITDRLVIRFQVMHDAAMQGFLVSLQEEEADIENRIMSELNLLLKGEPCQTATVINQIISPLAASVAKQIKASYDADLSHLSASMNSDAIEQGLASQPMLASALAGMSKRGKSKMLNNPFVQLALAGLENKGLLSGNGNNGHVPINNHQINHRRHRDG